MVSKLLFDLVKSLSSTEKRYISVQYKSSKHRKYVQLLKAIEKQEIYDLESLKNAVGGTENAFFVRQKEVYESILKILRNYHSHKAPSTVYLLRNMLQNVELLYQKSLYDNCLKQLKSIRKLAQKYEHYLILEAANQWERKIIYAQMDMTHLRKRMDLLEISSKTNTNIIHNEALYWGALFKMLSLVREQAFINADGEHKLKMLQEDKDIELLSNIDKALSHQAKTVFLFTNSFKEQVSGNITLAKDYARKMIEETNEHMHIYKEDSSFYVSGLSMLILMSQMLGEFDAVEPYIEILKKAPRTRFDSEHGILTRYYQAKFISLSETYRFQEAAKLIEEVEQQKQKLKMDILPGTFEFFAAAILIFVNRYEEAVRYLEVLVNTSKAKNRIDTQGAAKVLYLLCQYELGNKDYVANITRNTRRFLRSNNLLGEVEGLLLKFFKQVDSFTSSCEELKALTLLKDEVNAFKKKNGMKGFLAYFDILYWLKSKGVET